MAGPHGDLNPIRGGVPGPAACARGPASDEAPTPAGLLREPSAIAQAILDSTTEMFAWYGDDLRIQWTNRAAAESIHKAPADMIGRTCHEVWHGRASPCDNCPVLRARQSGRTEEAQVTTPDGRVWRIRGYPVLDGQGRVEAVFEFGFEITEQVRSEVSLQEAQQALQRSRQRYRTIIDTSPMSIFLVRDGRYLFANPAAGRMLGIAPEQVSGAPIEKTIHPDDLAATRARIAAASAGSGNPPMDLRILRPDGSQMLVQSTSVPIQLDDGPAILVMGIDITHRRTVEQSLRQRDSELASIFRAAPIGIGMVIDRVIQAANDRLCAMTGYRLDELLGQSARMLYPTQEEYEAVGRDKYRLIRESGTGTVETRWVAKDGRVMNILLSSTPLDVEHPEFGVTFTALDVTEHRAAQREQMELQRRLLHVQKLESLGVMAGGIAHDFNNLLAAVLGNLDMALTEMDEADAPARLSVREAIEAARRATDLTRQMLAYSGRGQTVARDVDLDVAIRDSAQILRVAVPRTISLDLQLHGALPAVVADPGQIQQVVMNLLTNAAEAYEGGAGVVSIRTGLADCTARELVRAAAPEPPPPGRYVWLEVADDGCGMSDETRQRLFDPFYSTKFTGRGLGMSVVHGIVRGHGGGLLVESAPGRGTRIRVLLPATDHAADAGEPSPRAAEGKPDVRGGRVLVVDDDPALRKVCRRMLEQAGFEVVEAADGPAALEALQKAAAPFEVVLLDYTMPRMHGFDVLKAIRQTHPALPVILCSGYSQQQATQRFAEAGLSGFLQKPYGLQELLDAIAKALRRD